MVQPCWNIRRGAVQAPRRNPQSRKTRLGCQHEAALRQMQRYLHDGITRWAHRTDGDSGVNASATLFSSSRQPCNVSSVNTFNETTNTFTLRYHKHPLPCVHRQDTGVSCQIHMSDQMGRRAESNKDWVLHVIQTWWDRHILRTSVKIDSAGWFLSIWVVRETSWQFSLPKWRRPSYNLSVIKYPSHRTSGDPNLSRNNQTYKHDWTLSSIELSVSRLKKMIQLIKLQNDSGTRGPGASWVHYARPRI